ncbi:MAG TPA: hypothetical protein VK211_21705 [Kamptonema sp.]|nr:hypothetical protein [Kamptonema sp.]
MVLGSNCILMIFLYLPIDRLLAALIKRKYRVVDGLFKDKIAAVSLK